MSTTKVSVEIKKITKVRNKGYQTLYLAMKIYDTEKRLDCFSPNWMSIHSPWVKY